jgi:ABC-type sugar transport system permease subunit
MTASSGTIPQRAFEFIHKRSIARTEALTGFMFLAPWIIGFLAFTCIPMVLTLLMTFSNFRLVQAEPLQFIGLTNYAKLLNDPQMRQALLVTLRFGIIALPVSLLFPILLAALINNKTLWGRGIFYTLFYMPAIVPLVSAAFIWRGVLNPQTGWFNMILNLIGVSNPPDWFTSPAWVYPALTLMGLWGVGTGMVTMLAAMQGVSPELYEAAQVDGAGPIRRFFAITLPMISPVIFYNLLLGIVGLFQYFLPAIVLFQGNGNPAGSTWFLNLYLYKQFFTYQDMAYGATLAWLMFMLILVITGFLWWSQKFWVFYASDK